MDEEIILILPGEHANSNGIAIGVGTTTMAAYLCDLATMEAVETVSMMNPQCKYGEDVMSRISYHVTNEDNLQKINADLIEAINDSLIARACESTHPPKEKDKSKD